MPKKEKTKSYKRIFWTAAALAALLALAFPLADNISQELAVNREIEELQQEIAEMESRNTELKGLIEYLRSDQFAMEQARLKLNMKNPGEEVVVIKEKEPSVDIMDSADEAGSLASAAAAKSNPRLWWEYFFDKH